MPFGLILDERFSLHENPPGHPESSDRNRALLEKLLSRFSERYCDAADKILHDLRDGNSKSAQAYVHTIKGTAGNLSAKGIYDAALKLEKAIETGSENVGTEIESFRAAINQVVTGLEEIKAS